MPLVLLIKNHKYALSIYYMPGNLLGVEETVADQRPFLLSERFLVMETDSNKKSKHRDS